MRHYEIVFLVIRIRVSRSAMIDRYKGMIAANNGQVHRLEDWVVASWRIHFQVHKGTTCC